MFPLIHLAMRGEYQHIPKNTKLTEIMNITGNSVIKVDVREFEIFSFPCHSARTLPGLSWSGLSRTAHIRT
jgi:hypothetical protein